MPSGYYSQPIQMNYGVFMLRNPYMGYFMQPLFRASASTSIRDTNPIKYTIYSSSLALFMQALVPLSPENWAHLFGIIQILDLHISSWVF